MTMKNIKDYRTFCLNESEGLFFNRHNMGGRYEERTNDYNVSQNPTVLGRVGNFFQKMENRLSRMADYGSNLAKSHRAERGGGINTGYEALFGLTTVVPGILKRIFGPTKYEFSRKPDDKVDLDLMRHTNEDFIKNDLPSIRSEEQMISHADEIYKRGNIRPGDHPIVDDIVRNRANLYYERELNPNSEILRTNQQNINNYN